MLRRLRTRVDNMVKRGVIHRVDESKKTARVQITLLKDEVDDDVEVLGQFGFYMSPPAGAGVVVLNVGGNADHPVVIATNMPGDRPRDLADSRTGGIYRLGEWVLFVDADGVVHVGAETGAAFIARADRVLSELQAIRTWANSHVHPDPVSGNTGTATVPLAAPSSVAATKAKVT